MTTPGDPSHRHDQLHRGLVPTDQLASGTATVGYVPISAGATAEWGPQSGGGGGDCEHQHTYDRFVAAGGSPETFPLAAVPIDGLVDVRINGSSADPDDVTLTGSDVDVDTSASDVVVIWYAKACAELAGAVADTDPGDPGYSWYDAGTVWPPTLGTWAANTEYPAGSFILDSNGHTQVRYPAYPGRSDSSEPTWDTGGSYTADLDGYWFDLGISPDFDALTQAWTDATNFGTDDSVVIVEPTTPNGHRYIGATTDGLVSGSVEPVWPTATGNDTLVIGGYPGEVITWRPFVTGSATIDLNGDPLIQGVDWHEQDETQGWIVIDIGTGIGDVLHITYTPA